MLRAGNAGRSQAARLHAGVSPLFMHVKLPVSCQPARFAPASFTPSLQHCHISTSSSPSAPHFTVPASHIQPLSTPSQFYDTLLKGCSSAQSRISLASLYVGTGHLEQQLVQCIADSAAARGPAMQVAIQMDYNRCLRDLSRGKAGFQGYSSSAQLLLELLRRDLHCARVDCGLTLLPQHRGLLGKLLGQRWVEGLGVFHLKAYAWDNTVLLSGANLSSDYFTNRQDRYVLIEEAPQFAQYVHCLLEDLRELPGSHVLTRQGKVEVVQGGDSRGEGRNAEGGKGENGSSSLLPSSAPFSWAALPHVSPLRQGGTTQQQDEAYAAGLAEVLQHYSSGSFAGCSLREGRGGKGVQGSGSKAAAASSCHPSPVRVPSRAAILTPRLQLGLLGARQEEGATLRLLASVQGMREGRDRTAGPAAAEAAASRAAAPAVSGTASLPSSPSSPAASSSPPSSPQSQDLLHIATGYFNLPLHYRKALLQSGGGSSSVHVLTAAPSANGFLNAHGMSGAIPFAYSEIERRFWQEIVEAGRLHPVSQEGKEVIGKEKECISSPGIALYEYSHPGWTFHAKGLWLERGAAGKQPATGPAADADAGAGAATVSSSPTFSSSFTSLIGSSNFAQRSTDRDLELQLQLDTDDERLMGRLRRERDALFGHGNAAKAPEEAAEGARAAAAARSSQDGDQQQQPSAPATAVSVAPVQQSLWQQESRRIGGTGLHNGSWLILGWRFFSPYL